MNKLIVVTGGTKGIGRAILDKFASTGFDIVTCARNANDLALLKSGFEKKYGIRAHIIVADMAERSQVESFVKFIIDLGRTVDVLVNNSGYFVSGQVIDEPDGTLERMMDSNVYSAYYVTRGIVKGMTKVRHGHIFNMCSIASLAAYPNGGSYTISKFALLGFSKVLREELKESGIRVTAILPGATRTASWEGSQLSEERFMKPEDVAEAVYGAYSLSERSVVEEIIIRPQLGDI